MRVEQDCGDGNNRTLNIIISYCVLGLNGIFYHFASRSTSMTCLVSLCISAPHLYYFSPFSSLVETRRMQARRVVCNGHIDTTTPPLCWTARSNSSCCCSLRTSLVNRVCEKIVNKFSHIVKPQRRIIERTQMGSVKSSILYIDVIPKVRESYFSLILTNQVTIMRILFPIIAWRAEAFGFPSRQ